MLDFNTEKNIAFLRAAGIMLSQRVFELEKQLVLARYEKKIDDDLLQLLSADLELLRKKFFDKSSEKKSPNGKSKSKTYQRPYRPQSQTLSK